MATPPCVRRISPSVTGVTSSMAISVWLPAESSQRASSPSMESTRTGMPASEQTTHPSCSRVQFPSSVRSSFMSVDLGGFKFLQLLFVVFAYVFQGAQGGVGFGFVDFGHGEAHVDQDPVPDLHTLLVVVDQSYVYVAPDAADLRFGDRQVFVYDLHDPSWYPQTHVFAP